MEHVSSHRPEQDRSERQDALRWSLFLLIAVVVVAAVMAGAIRGRFAPAMSGVQPALNGGPSPSPSPLPKPGPAPPGTLLAGL
jgi:hypothetical protein